MRIEIQNLADLYAYIQPGAERARNSNAPARQKVAYALVTRIASACRNSVRQDPQEVNEAIGQLQDWLADDVRDLTRSCLNTAGSGRMLAWRQTWLMVFLDATSALNKLYHRNPDARTMQAKECLADLPDRVNRALADHFSPDVMQALFGEAFWFEFTRYLWKSSIDDHHAVNSVIAPMVLHTAHGPEPFATRVTCASRSRRTDGFFLHPEQLPVLVIEADFARAFMYARECCEQLFLSEESPERANQDVSVRIDADVLDRVFIYALQGNSVGGALFVGLYACIQQTETDHPIALKPNLAISFALDGTQHCRPVGGIFQGGRPLKPEACIRSGVTDLVICDEQYQEYQAHLGNLNVDFHSAKYLNQAVHCATDAASQRFHNETPPAVIQPVRALTSPGQSAPIDLPMTRRRFLIGSGLALAGVTTLVSKYVLEHEQATSRYEPSLMLSESYESQVEEALQNWQSQSSHRVSIRIVPSREAMQLIKDTPADAPRPDIWLSSTSQLMHDLSDASKDKWIDISDSRRFRPLTSQPLVFLVRATAAKRAIGRIDLDTLLRSSNPLPKLPANQVRYTCANIVKSGGGDSTIRYLKWVYAQNTTRLSGFEEFLRDLKTKGFTKNLLDSGVLAASFVASTSFDFIIIHNALADRECKKYPDAVYKIVPAETIVEHPAIAILRPAWQNHQAEVAQLFNYLVEQLPLKLSVTSVQTETPDMGDVNNEKKVWKRVFDVP